MVVKKKVESVRRYLRSEQRVFVNNVIVTLPSDTKLLDSKKNTIDVDEIKVTTKATIQIPSRFGSVGIIDGQHRLFGYYESGGDDGIIDQLRRRQNLLVTGIIFPSDMHEDAKLRFQGRIFLEINSTQAGAKSELKQDIEMVLRPFSAEAIAKRVINRLNDGSGPLADRFERYFYETGKIKTTSVVSYGLRQLVRPGGPESLYRVWQNESKADLIVKKNDALLEEYVDFCRDEIDKFMSAVKESIPKERWTSDRSVANRFLGTTQINGCINCVRQLVKHGKISHRHSYLSALSDIATFPFGDFKSSQYNALGRQMFARFFSPE